MSGGSGGIGKVFSKVAKTVMKVAPIVLAVAAVVFTAGAGLAAMGVISSTSLLGGGLGAAMTGLAGSMGLSGTLAGVVAGGLTQAAYGSVIGGAISGITGGDVMKGMQMGALSGAVTGGITGGLGGTIDPIGEGIKSMGSGADMVGGAGDEILAGSGGGDALQFAADGSVVPDAAPGAFTSGNTSMLANSTVDANSGAAWASQYGSEAARAATTAANAAPGAFNPATAMMNSPAEAFSGATSGGGLLTGVSGFVERNPDLVGKVGGGLAEGAMRGMAAGDSADALKEAAAIKSQGDMDMERAKQEQIASNYSNPSGGGLLTQQNIGYMQGQDGTRPTPTQRFDGRSYGGQWVYDQKVGRIVFHPG